MRHRPHRPHERTPSSTHPLRATATMLPTGTLFGGVMTSPPPRGLSRACRGVLLLQPGGNGHWQRPKVSVVKVSGVSRKSFHFIFINIVVVTFPATPITVLLPQDSLTPLPLPPKLPKHNQIPPTCLTDRPSPLTMARPSPPLASAPSPARATPARPTQLLSQH